MDTHANIRYPVVFRPPLLVSFTLDLACPCQVPPDSPEGQRQGQRRAAADRGCSPQVRVRSSPLERGCCQPPRPQHPERGCGRQFTVSVSGGLCATFKGGAGQNLPVTDTHRLWPYPLTLHLPADAAQGLQPARTAAPSAAAQVRPRGERGGAPCHLGHQAQVNRVWGGTGTARTRSATGTCLHPG